MKETLPGEKFEQWMRDERIATVMQSFGITELSPEACALLVRAVSARVPGRGKYEAVAEVLAPYAGNANSAKALITSLRVAEEAGKGKGVRLLNG